MTSEQCPPGLWKTPQALTAPAQTTPDSAALATWAPEEQAPQPPLTQAEHTQLHVRIIALENLVIAMLASATDHQLECAREMAAYITPRPGATAHPLTTHAAGEMVSMMERAIHFRGTQPK